MYKITIQCRNASDPNSRYWVARLFNPNGDIVAVHTSKEGWARPARVCLRKSGCKPQCYAGHHLEFVSDDEVKIENLPSVG